MRLTGRELGAVDRALLAAFGLKALDRLLLHGLSLDRERFSVGDDLEEIVFMVTRELNRREQVPELISVARACNPGNRELGALAERFLTEPVRSGAEQALERLLSGDRQRMHDAADWHAKLGVVQRRVARVELVGGAPLGTAFLIGPDLVLTNHHVLASLLDGRSMPEQIRFRFDVRSRHDGAPLSAGIVYALAEEWLVDATPPSSAELRGVDDPADPGPDELDFAVVRLDGSPGAEPVEEAREVPGAPIRGWLTPSADTVPPADGDPLFILQHPAGEPLKLAFDRVLGCNSAGTRLRHAVDTEPGSSGSPCFDRSLDVVALHHSGDPAWRPAFNQAVPIAPIMRRLARKAVRLG